MSSALHDLAQRAINGLAANTDKAARREWARQLQEELDALKAAELEALVTQVVNDPAVLAEIERRTAPYRTPPPSGAELMQPIGRIIDPPAHPTSLGEVWIGETKPPPGLRERDTLERAKRQLREHMATCPEARKGRPDLVVMCCKEGIELGEIVVVHEDAARKARQQ